MTAHQPDGFLATPAAGSGPGVLVLHAWWGLNDAIRQVCRRLADEGYAAFAPDLYHGQTADAIPGAEALSSTLDANYEQAAQEVAAAARFLAEQAGQKHGGLAVIGFSLGAFYALDLSNAEPALIRSVVIFYGSGPDDFSDSQAAYLGHFAENDPYEPPASVDYLEDALRRAGRPATIHRYPGVGHWFCEPDRTDAYDEAAATLAWARTLAFLAQRDAGG